MPIVLLRNTPQTAIVDDMNGTAETEAAEEEIAMEMTIRTIGETAAAMIAMKEVAEVDTTREVDAGATMTAADVADVVAASTIAEVVAAAEDTMMTGVEVMTTDVTIVVDEKMTEEEVVITKIVDMPVVIRFEAQATGSHLLMSMLPKRRTDTARIIREQDKNRSLGTMALHELRKNNRLPKKLTVKELRRRGIVTVVAATAWTRRLPSDLALQKLLAEANTCSDGLCFEFQKTYVRT